VKGIASGSATADGRGAEGERVSGVAVSGLEQSVGAGLARKVHPRFGDQSSLLRLSATPDVPLIRPLLLVRISGMVVA
jgi:hypothetical protein